MVPKQGPGRGQMLEAASSQGQACLLVPSRYGGSQEARQSLACGPQCLGPGKQIV